MSERLFLQRLTGLLVLSTLCSIGLAQETDRNDARAAEIDALEPAVDVSAVPRAAERAVPRTPASQGTPGVVDRLDLGTTSITGNQELPKVLYIVPWKRSDLGNLVGRPVNTLLDEVLAPVDPEVFERHLDYYDTLNGAREQE
ncbi:MAG TPA: hypothetical protein VKQ06_09675 [Gammaproteobacteria bacterium]|nr:hypothetical protein [Gammaproteobacteria bacterium]